MDVEDGSTRSGVVSVGKVGVEVGPSENVVTVGKITSGVLLVSVIGSGDCVWSVTASG